MSIFKAYDIRGLVPQQLSESEAFKIGQALADFYRAPLLAVGRDMRVSGPALRAALIQGLTESGVDVLDIGLVDTPRVYFAVGRLRLPGGVMITASHNPGEYNGFKLCREQAIPISYDTGIQKIEQLFQSGAQPAQERSGLVVQVDLNQAYLDYLHAFIGPLRPLKVAIDCGNGMGGSLARELFEPLGLQIVPLFFELDGRFPNHEANPLEAKNMRWLQAAVVGEQCDLGIAFDGDADRVMFVDERGELIPSDMITLLIAANVLAGEPGATILYDLRSSQVVPEAVRAAGGRPLRCRVGHAFIKKRMREVGAAFAGELSGHYYFRDNYYADSGYLAALKVLEIVSQSSQPLSQGIRPYQRYHASGEINSKVSDPDRVLAELDARFPGQNEDRHLDGLLVEGEGWWFNVRKSNTEPLVRLNLEARDRELMEKMRDQVLELIRSI